ncbi:MAG: hypothetical protein WD250_17675 [Egibacteraceae bacterium]
MTYPQIYTDDGVFDAFDEDPLPERPVDPERAFLGFIAVTIVLLMGVGAFVVVLTQPPW